MCYNSKMIITNLPQNNATSFGMKFKFTRLSPHGDWYGADREFFNSTYQIGLIQSELEKIKPKNDIFELKLDLPTGDIFPDAKGILTTSYKMFADIIRKGKIIRSVDLSEKNIKLNYFDDLDRLEVHEKGPCSKVLDFIEGLNNPPKRK